MHAIGALEEPRENAHRLGISSRELLDRAEVHGCAVLERIHDRSWRRERDEAKARHLLRVASRRYDLEVVACAIKQEEHGTDRTELFDRTHEERMSDVGLRANDRRGVRHDVRCRQLFEERRARCREAHPESLRRAI
jgi:hypothetical protein